MAPAYDGVGEQTALVASQVGFEIITSWVAKGMSEMEKVKEEASAGGQGKDEL